MTQDRSSIRQKSIFMLLVSAGLFLIGAAVVIFYLPRARDQALAAGYSAVPAEVNLPAPDLTLTDLSGKTVSLRDYRGTTVLVNNWATWCPPCKAEMPVLEAYYKAHASQGFVIVAIESGEPASQVADFVSQYGLTFPVWLDAGGLALDAFKNWDLPSSYVVDGSGIIRLSWTGPISLAMLEAHLTPLLEK
jgi:peroxiredoxin